MKITLEPGKVKPKTKIKVSKTSLANREKVSNDVLPEDNKIFRKLPPILFPYQQKFVKAAESDKYEVLVFSKSRRIGGTHGLASYAVLEAAKKGGKNFFYIGTSLGMSREFIESCSYWSRHFNVAASHIQEVMIKDESEDILTLRIHFASGKKIEALSSKPSSTRGRQGHVCLDEAAQLKNLQEYLDAALALQIWGGKTFVVSTHFGIDNEFNTLCELIKKGEKPYYLQETTFKEAVKQGFYERVCLMEGREYTKEDEKKWVKKIYSQYGDSASQELDCVPSTNSANSIFKASWFIKISREDLPKYYDYQVLAWDFAATDKDDSCYTVGILIGKYKGNFYILNWYPCKKDAKSTQNYVISKVNQQPKDVPVYIELEGGSQSILWLENSFKPLLKGYRVRGVRPEGSKAVRSLPCAEAAEKGKVFIVNEKWSDDFLKVINQFEGIPGVPLISDTGDALSLGFTQVDKGIKGLVGT